MSPLSSLLFAPPNVTKEPRVTTCSTVRPGARIWKSAIFGDIAPKRPQQRARAYDALGDTARAEADRREAARLNSAQ